MDYQKPENNTQQNAFLDIQENVSSKSRIVNIITIILFLAFIFSFAIGFFLVKENDFSEQENRLLLTRQNIQTKLSGSSNYVLDGSFTSDIGKYYADQFPFRDFFVGLKGLSEISLGKGENNDILCGKDGYLIKREEKASREKLDSNIDEISQFASKLNENNIPFYVAFAGSPISELGVYENELFDNSSYENDWEYFAGQLIDKGICFINLKTVLENKINENVEKTNPEDQIIYKTDHHWTSFGAYYGYEAICKEMSITSFLLDEFSPELASDSFYGTTWSEAGMKWVKPDSMYYLRYDGDDTDYQTTIIDNGKSYLGFYDREYLNKKDKYASFISGNNAKTEIVKINNVEEKREKILVIKDSYAHCLVPMLARNCDLTIIDLRYLKESPIAIATSGEYDKVLLISYFGSISNTNAFALLKYGL